MTMTTTTTTASTSRPPPATLATAILCITVYAFQICFFGGGEDHAWNQALNMYTLCPKLVVYSHEYHRIVTSGLFHANLMHIVMNTTSFLTIGSLLEKQLGTLRLFFTAWYVRWPTTLDCAIVVPNPDH